MSMDTAKVPSGLTRYLPILYWLPNYSSVWLRSDLVAGLTTAAVVIPQSMAYATIAGLPVEAGLYTALVPMLIYALLGTSRPLSVSVTSTISMLTAAQLALVVQSGDPADYMAAASTLALLVGGFLLLAGVLRLGFIANFISIPVLTGFKAGIGMVVFVGQLGKVLGIPVSKGPFFQTIIAVVQGLNAVHWATFLVALVTLAILIVLPRLVPRVPAPLVAVVVGIGASAVLVLGDAGVKLVGFIPPGLPPLALPDPSLISQLWPGALAIALMCFTESVAAGRAFVQHGEPQVDANQELLAMGAANVAGSFFRAYPAAGGTSQTAVNRKAGANTQLSGIVTACVVALTLLFLSPLVSQMPQATLGALVLVAAVSLIKPDDFRAIARIRREELSWALVALAGVVLLGTLEGILVAVAVSLLTLMYHANHPPVYAVGRKPGADVFRSLEQHPDDETIRGLLIVRTEGRLHFASAPRTTDTFWHLIEEAQPSVLILELSAVPDIEYTALTMLADAEGKLREHGISLWLAGLNSTALEVVRRSPLGATLGDEHIYDDLQQAVKAYEAMDK
jgi:SulP family sulfate permease